MRPDEYFVDPRNEIPRELWRLKPRPFETSQAKLKDHNLKDYKPKHQRPRPPSTARIWPVMNCGAVEKKRTAAAISSSRPLRSIGVCLAMRRINAAADFWPRSIMPGATAFTAISGARALAMTLVSMCRAALEEQ